MKHIAYGTVGTPESMSIVEGATPVPSAGEILIEVAYAGVNRPDVAQRSGRYPPPSGASPILGLEVAGRVAALGADVAEWRVGDSVTALVPGGGYAEYCLAPALHALPIPAGMGLAEAAGLPETWFTVWANLMDIGRLKSGERLLVHGGSSGIGLTAILLGKHVGAEVFVTVGNQEKADFCKAYGADFTIDYSKEDFVAKVKEITAGEGVDVVLDMVGGGYLQRDVNLLRRDGRLVMIAFLQGSRAEFDFLPVMLKRLSLGGSTMRPRSVAEKAAIRDALLQKIWPSLATGQMKPHLFATFPLDRAAEAHRLMESSRHIGKIVLQVRA
jgi:putative PIG3 family NAD(P)H quinone oxidoreductase